MKQIGIICLLMLSSLWLTSIKAQDKWDLNRCITYALENNLTVQKQLLKIDYDQLQIRQAKNNFLPSFDAGLSNQTYFGRSLNLSNNQYENYNSNETSFNLGGSWSLFQGFRLKYAKEARLLDLQSSKLSLEQINNSIGLSIASSYLDILLNKEMIETLQEQLNVTKEDGRRVKIRYEAGDVSKDVYLEIKAQIAREQHQLIEARSNHSNSLLTLAQILDVEDYERFDVQIPDLPLIESKVSFLTARDVFESALSLPEIKNAELQIENDQLAIAQAKSGFYPTLSVYANYYNFYNNKSQVYDPLTNTSSDQSFVDQLSKHPREVLGLNVHIPIFSRFQNRTNVKMAMIQKENSILDLAIEKKNLRANIQTAYSNAKSTYAQYLSAVEALEATREASRFAAEKYKVGEISPFDYNTSKAQLTKSEAELLQAKYNFIFATKVLEFYNGIPLEF